MFKRNVKAFISFAVIEQLPFGVGNQHGRSTCDAVHFATHRLPFISEFHRAADRHLEVFRGAFVLRDQLVLVIGMPKKSMRDPVELAFGAIAVIKTEHLDQMDKFVFADPLGGLHAIFANTSTHNHRSIQIVKGLEQ